MCESQIHAAAAARANSRSCRHAKGGVRIAKSIDDCRRVRSEMLQNTW